ncbi:putative integrase [Waddlia chondrophila WSU 86-1044]|uniref:Putative integrase n=2 Tax=Waddlia chondrophila TaxID=71667 RepID=D6YUV3_WADCW|nr:putative integrase [Waddlia chondrophila WSU 86-1044]
MSNMASIRKFKKKNGKYSYKAIVRVNDGYPPDYKSFPTRKEAKDWGTQIEASRRQGSYFPEQVKAKHTLADLIDRYLNILQSTKPKSTKDIVRHLEWWKKRLGKYAVRNITADLIAGCRQELAEGSTYKGTMRSPSTVNRYLASLSGV